MGRVSKHGCYATLAQKALFQIQIFHQAGLENGMWFITMACSFQLCLIFQVKVAAGSISGRREEHVRTRVFSVRFHWLALGSAGSKHKHFPKKDLAWQDAKGEKKGLLLRWGAKRSYLLAEEKGTKDAERVLGSCFSGCYGSQGKSL